MWLVLTSMVPLDDAGRYLQETTVTPVPTMAPTMAPTTNSTEEQRTEPNDSEVLRNTLRVFGSLFIVCFLLYAWLRKRYPRAYNPRSWSEHMKCELAQTYYGHFSWLWKLALITEDDFREQCGLDALCFLRVFRFGLKVTLMGMFTSVWLLPLYGTAEESAETAHITDPIASITVSNVPPSSSRFIGTVVASYFIFIYTMYLILKEFEWFTEQRHQWLMYKAPRNYAIFVRGIPSELRSSAKLLEYFRSCFSEEAVLEARVAIVMPSLERKVAAREATVFKLEHAINVEEVKGKTPMLNNPLNSEAPRNAITAYSEDLQKLNEEITLEKATYLAMHDPFGTSPFAGHDDFSVVQNSIAGTADGIANSEMSSLTGIDTAVRVEGRSTRREDVDAIEEEGVENDSSKKSGGNALSKTVLRLQSDIGDIGGQAAGMASAAVNVFTNEEGQAKTGGFVTFTNLSARQAALRTVHDPKPFVFDVAEAPDPEDIVWINVGRTNKDLQVGKLISISLTTLLCFFWTIPVAFILSLTNVETLSEKVPFLRDWIEAAPWIGSLLEQLAPLILIGINELLKIFLELFSTLEGPVSSGVLEASIFSKLTVFQIVQTFFVASISGSILQELTNAINNPSSIVDLLANSLPGQSTFFLQILLIQTSIGLSIELLRVSKISVAICRRLIGPNLTEKERNTTIFGFLRPLANPYQFEHADVLANVVLYFMVLFVYSTMAPIVNWFLGICFIVQLASYRNQFVYCYPVTDSGGRLWLFFMGTVQVAMLIAQITLLGFLGLKKAAVAFPLMIPLLIITFLFTRYVGQQHFLRATFLATRECVKRDAINSKSSEWNVSFLKDEFLQPALRAEDELQAENMGIAREIEHAGVTYCTPPGSEADLEDRPAAEEDISLLESNASFVGG